MQLFRSVPRVAEGEQRLGITGGRSGVTARLHAICGDGLEGRRAFLRSFDTKLTLSAACAQAPRGFFSLDFCWVDQASALLSTRSARSCSGSCAARSACPSNFSPPPPALAPERYPHSTLHPGWSASAAFDSPPLLPRPLPPSAASEQLSPT